MSLERNVPSDLGHVGFLNGFSQCCLMNDVVHNTKNDLVPGMFLADV